MRSVPLRSVLTVAGLMVAPLSAFAAHPIVDEGTGTRFHEDQSVNGTRFQCLGAGVREVFMVKVYAAEFCLQEGSLQPALGYVGTTKATADNPSKLEKTLSGDPEFFKTIIDAPGDKLLIMHLVRDVSRDELAKAFRKSLSKVLPPENVEKLIAIIPGDGKKNEDVKLSSAGDTLTIDIAGNANQVRDGAIAKQIWWVWLGKDSVSPSLKKSIAKNMAEGL
jgi:hypothetical protein